MTQGKITRQENVRWFKNNLKKDKYFIEHFIENNGLLMAIKEMLNEREIKVIATRYFMDLTQEDVGMYFGVTTERIRQIEYKALYKLKFYNAKKIKELFNDYCEEKNRHTNFDFSGMTYQELCY